MSPRGPELPCLSTGVSLQMRLQRIVPSGQTQPGMCWVTCLPPTRETWELDLASSCKEAHPCACWASPGSVITEADWLACDRKAGWISPLEDRALRVFSLVPYLTPTLQISKSSEEGSDRAESSSLSTCPGLLDLSKPQACLLPLREQWTGQLYLHLRLCWAHGKKAFSKKCSPCHLAVLA